MTFLTTRSRFKRGFLTWAILWFELEWTDVLFSKIVVLLYGYKKW